MAGKPQVIRFIGHAAAAGNSSAVPSPIPTSDPARPESLADAQRACPFGVMYAMAPFKRTRL
jgi:hypothetical protein